MLPTKSCHLAQSVNRSLRIVSRNFASASTVPLTDALSDNNTGGKTVRRGSGSVTITKLENGVNIASVDNGGSVSRLSVALKAGSRFESSSEQGITHLLRNAAFITNNDRTSLRTVRDMQQIGGSLESSNTRELISRNAIFIRNNLAQVLENVAPGITSPLFNSWDLKEVKALCKSENATLATNPAALNFEMLHKAAFRTSLGNSIFCDKLRIDSFSPSQVEEFTKQYYVGERLTVVGTDVDHDELVRCVTDLFGSLPRGNPSQRVQSKYSGGEAHLNTATGLTYASLFSEGAGLFDANLPVLSVLQKALGSGPYIKWGSNTVSSRLNKAASSVTDGPLMINALNLSYSDAGLFGFHAVCTPQVMTSVLKSAVSQVSTVTKGELSVEDLERAKTQAAASVLMVSESNEDVLDDLVKQVAFSGKYISPTEAIAEIEKVNLDQVVQVSKKVFGSKPSLTVTGDVCCAPYVDYLF